jgi:hypothetical protein
MYKGLETPLALSLVHIHVVLVAWGCRNGKKAMEEWQEKEKKEKLTLRA